MKKIEDEIQNLNLEETQNSKKRPLWAIKIVEEAQDFTAPSGTSRESKRPKRFSSYATNMSDFSKLEPTNVSDAIKHTTWKDAMMEEYQPLLRMMFEKLFQGLKENLLFLLNEYLKSSML